MKFHGKTIGWGPWRKDWYSLCSRHYDWQATCDICQAGSYLNVWCLAISQAVFWISPTFWRWWKNG